MIEQPIFENPAKTACPKKFWLTFEIFFRATRRSFEWSIQLLAIFLSLVHRINLILHILTILNGVNNLVMIWLMLDHSKSRKMHFWMIQRAKTEVFVHFLEFSPSDQLDIAYCDSTNCFQTCTRSKGSFKNHENVFLNDPIKYLPFS